MWYYSEEYTVWGWQKIDFWSDIRTCIARDIQPALEARQRRRLKIKPKVVWP